MDVLETLAFILPVISAISVLLLIFVNAYTNIRSRFPIKVNCWFCNVWLKVPYNKQNSWNCPNCEQYNGFTPDGEYNQPIPAQHDELMNKAVPLKTKTTRSTENGLCNICNHNQRLKVHQLATFSPLDEMKYDEEISRYKEQLERSYRLCPQCEKVLKLTLQKQKSTILDQQLKAKTNKISTPQKTITAKKSIYTKVLNYITIVIVILLLIEILTKCVLLKKYQKSLPMKLLKNSLILTTNFLNNIIDITKNYFETFYSNFNNINLINDIQTYLLNMTMLLTNNTFIKFFIQSLLNIDRIKFLTIIGFIAQLLIFKNKYHIGKIDFIKIFAWIVIASLESTNIIQQNYSEIIQIVSISFLIISWIDITEKPIKIKKSPIRKTKGPKINLMNDTLYNDFKPLDVTEIDKTLQNSSFNSSRSISPISTSSLYDQGFAFYKSTKDSFIFGQKAIFSNPLNTSFNNSNKFSPGFRAPSINLNDSSSSQNSLNNSDDTLRLCDTVNYAINEINRRKPIENELGEEFQKLHLGSFSITPSSIYKLPSAFKITSASRPKPVLTPPKLTNVTQSSWVAGGYWKPPYEFNDNFNSHTTLSRSSSQSSGFGSQSSSQNLNSIDLHNSLPNSRNTSICGEYDKFSVFSEPPYHYNKNNTRIYNNLPQDQHLYIHPRNKTSPTSVLNDSWRSCDSSFRPSSRNSLLSQNLYDFNSNRSITSEHTLKSYRTGYSRGSLCDDWHKTSFK